MNNLIQLKGQLTPRKNPSKGGGSSLPANTTVKVIELENIKNDLIGLEDYWKNKKLIDGTLINVNYNRIVPKSKRIKTILFKSSNGENIDSIRGAKYGGTKENPTHIITYYVPLDNISHNIKKLKECIEILNTNFQGKFDNEDEKKIKNIDFSKYDIAKTTFIDVISDCSIVR